MKVVVLSRPCPSRFRIRPARSNPGKLVLASLAAVLLAFTFSPLAHATPIVGLDVTIDHPGGRDDMELGLGGGVRAGNQWRLLILTLTPEVSANYSHFEGAQGATGYRLMGGGRLGLGFLLEPSIFAHAGAGYLDRAGTDDGLGLAFDTGVALDLTALPVVDVGLHAQVAGIAATGAPSGGLTWASYGVHLAFKLDD